MGPAAHIPWVQTSRDSIVAGMAPPSLRVDLPLRALNYQITSPLFPIPDTTAAYTVEVSLRVEQPDASLRVEAFVCDFRGWWLQELPILDITGAQMTEFRRYRMTFRLRHGPRDVPDPGGPIRAEPVLGDPQPGTAFLMFGLPFRKLLRAGRFWIDDLTVRAGAEAEPLELYLRPTSVGPGEPVEVHLSCGRGDAELRLFREGTARTPVAAPIPLHGLSAQPAPADAYMKGCGWPVTTSISTAGLTPGVYIVQVDDGDRPVDASFVVHAGTAAPPGEIGSARAADRGFGNLRSAASGNPVLVVIPTHTEQAYNAWGGRSLYSHPRSSVLSFERPFDWGVEGLYAAPIHLIRWLEREGIPYETANDDDLNDRPGLLFRYAGVILCWHSEYWTRSMREGLESYVAAGGSVLSLSGNTCWWQTRVETPQAPCGPAGGPAGCPAPTRLVCYKSGFGEDPCLHIAPDLVTTNWDIAPVNDPPERLFGLNYRYGGMVNWSTSGSCPCRFDWLDGHGGYRAFHTGHWVFAGTGLADGETFGREQAIVGYEVDGAPLVERNGIPEIAPGFASPAGFEVLGTAPCFSDLVPDSAGTAVMGIVERGRSFVFNGGTTGWCWGLAADPVVQQITRNLINRLPAAPPARPEGCSLVIAPNPAGAKLLLRFVGRVPDEALVVGPDGRRVGRLEPARTSDAWGRLQWDLKDGRGQDLPSGVYWVYAPGASPKAFVRVR